MTRELVERLAQTIHDRKARSGVSHAVVLAFGSRVPEAERVLVYEHLLRSGLEVQRPEQEGRAHYETAQERLRTHHADGSEQQWVIDRRTREAQAAKEKAEREARAAKEKAEREAREREEQRRREAQEKREAERKKLREDAKELGWEVGRYGKSEERTRRAAGLLAEAERLEVADLNKAYADGVGKGRKEAALDACRKAGAEIQYAHGGADEPACDEKTWEAVQRQARQAIEAAAKLGIPTEEAEGALYAGRDAVFWEQQRELEREMGGPGF